MARENNRAPRKAEENDGLIKKLIQVNRVTKVVKGGRNMSNGTSIQRLIGYLIPLRIYDNHAPPRILKY